MAEDKPKIQNVEIKTYDDIPSYQAEPPKVKVQQESIKTADPGVAFVLETEDQTPIGHALTVLLKVTDDQQNYYTSSLSVEDQIHDKKITCIVPFGDGNWSQLIQRAAKQAITTVDINFTIELKPCDPNTGRPTKDPIIHAQEPIDIKGINVQHGTFVITVSPVAGPEAGKPARKGGFLKRIFKRR